MASSPATDRYETLNDPLVAGAMRRAVHVKNYPADSIPEANYPSLRYLSRADDSWLVCSPETAVKISRVGFYFIRRVQRDALVPMGVMVTAVGGSKIESWLNQSPYPTGKHYEELLQPLVGFGIRGAVWYQGESNEADRRGYYPKLKSLILGWREAWGRETSLFTSCSCPGSANLRGRILQAVMAERRFAKLMSIRLP